ncbi:MAG: DUF5719 family protein [Nocardioides sp.]
MSATAGSRADRGRARRRVDLTVVLALVLPLVVLAAVLTLSPRQRAEQVHPPELAPLGRADLGCPRGVTAAAAVRVAGEAPAPAEAEVRPLPHSGEGEPQPLAVPAAGVAVVAAQREAAVVTGRDELAPGLRALRLDGRRLAAVACALPSPELVHRARCPVDPRLRARAGQPGRRGCGGRRHRLLAPRRPRRPRPPRPAHPRSVLDGRRPRGDRPASGDLAARLVVSRGRVVTSVLDQVGRAGAGVESWEWLPAQAAPDGATLLVGVAPGPGRRRLVVANPGDSEARATVRLVTPQSLFAPADAPELRLAPGAVGTLNLAPVLRGSSGKDVLGVLVEGTGPVTAGLAMSVGSDRALVSGGGRVTTDAAAVLPPGRARVELAGASSPGVADIVSLGADGTQLATERVELVPERGAVVELPRGTAVVRVSVQRASVVGSVVVTARGTVVLPLTESVRSDLQPWVFPAG